MDVMNDVEKVVTTWRCTFVYYTDKSIFFKQNSLQRLIAKIF